MPNHFEKRPLDFSNIHAMVGKSPAFIISMIDGFFEQIPDFISEMDDAIADENWKEVYKLAHRVKPVFSYVGRGDIMDFLDHVEKNTKKGLSDKQIPEDMEELKLELGEIIEQLRLEKLSLMRKV